MPEPTTTENRGVAYRPAREAATPVDSTRGSVHGETKMTEATGRITNDPIDWKIHNWEQVLPGTGFDRIEATARLVQLGAALTETLDQIARQEGLANQGDYQVLSILRLAHHQGQLVTATDVATKLQMTTATMVNRIDRLEKLGYTQRTPHPTDRRSTNLTITPEGIACVQRMVLDRTKERERRLAVLTDDERAALTTTLAKLAAAWT